MPRTLKTLAVAVTAAFAFVGNRTGVNASNAQRLQVPAPELSARVTLKSQRRCAMPEPYSWQLFEFSVTLRNESKADLVVFPDSVVVSRAVVARTADALSRDEHEYGLEWDLALNTTSRSLSKRLAPGGELLAKASTSVLATERPSNNPPKAISAGQHIMSLDVGILSLRGRNNVWMTAAAGAVEFNMPSTSRAGLPECK